MLTPELFSSCLGCPAGLRPAVAARERDAIENGARGPRSVDLITSARDDRARGRIRGPSAEPCFAVISSISDVSNTLPQCAEDARLRAPVVAVILQPLERKQHSARMSAHACLHEEPDVRRPDGWRRKSSAFAPKEAPAADGPTPMLCQDCEHAPPRVFALDETDVSSAAHTTAGARRLVFVRTTSEVAAARSLRNSWRSGSRPSGRATTGVV